MEDPDSSLDLLSLMIRTWCSNKRLCSISFTIDAIGLTLLPSRAWGVKETGSVPFAMFVPGGASSS